MTTWRAAACLATAAAMMPMGPAPVTSTSSPSTGNAKAVCTALPSGSKIAATSSGIPGAFHAYALCMGAEMPATCETVAAASADHMAFAAHAVSDSKIADV